MFDDVFKRGPKRRNRPFIESSCRIGHIRFFLKVLTDYIGSKFEVFFLVFFLVA